MSDYKLSGVKRRDFRAAKDKPETVKPIPRKKKHRPFLVLYRYRPEVFANALKNEGTTGYWYISKEFRKSNNAWRVWGRHHARHSAIESCNTLRKDRWSDHYEYKTGEEE